MKKKKRGFKGKWAISAEVHYSSSTAGLLLPFFFFFFFFSLLYLSSYFSLIFKFQGAFSLNERQIHVYFFLLSLSLYLLYECIFFFCTLK
jgi:flagellar biosynthesis protein FlhB